MRLLSTTTFHLLLAMTAILPQIARADLPCGPSKVKGSATEQIPVSATSINWARLDSNANLNLYFTMSSSSFVCPDECPAKTISQYLTIKHFNWVSHNDGLYYARSLETLDVSCDPTPSPSPSPTGEPLSISVNSQNLSPNGTADYAVSGGSGTYFVSIDLGSISNRSGSGYYYAPDMCYAGSGTLSVSDSDANSASVQVSFQGDPALCASPAPVHIDANPYFIAAGGSASYNISGGSGSYSVTVDYGGISSSSGSGSYTAPDLCTGATASITVTDTGDPSNGSATATVSFDGDMDRCGSASISVDSSSVGPNGSTNYSLTGGSGNYSVSVDQGSISNSSGSGTFHAPDQCYGGTATISVTDTSSNHTTTTQVSFDGDAAECFSSGDGGDGGSGGGSSVSISVENSSVGPSSWSNYTISGGSGSYWVSVDYGSVTNFNGSGSFVAPDQCSSGVATIQVYDSSNGGTASTQVYFSGDDSLCY